MAKLFALALLPLLLLSCNANDGTTKLSSQDSIQYAQKCIDFIKQVQPEFLDSGALVMDELIDLKPPYCQPGELNDPGVFTEEEIADLKNKKYFSFSKWNASFFGSQKIISSDTMKKIMKDGAKGWPYFLKNKGSRIYLFSMPVFLKKDTRCVFYSEYSCGDTCGAGHLVLYKKENSSWVKEKSFCNWSN